MERRFKARGASLELSEVGFILLILPIDVNKSCGV